MAVKVNNTENIRKAKNWSEQDDAALCLLLKRKLKDVSLAMKEAPSPYERSHLKATRRHYKDMLEKVENGTYNGDIIFAELQAASALRGQHAANAARLSTNAGAREYVNSYMDMDFDYESAFRKTRYYGVALPLILLVLSIAFIGIFIMGAFLPINIMEMAEDELNTPLDTFFFYKLGSGVNDIIIQNTGEWPAGVYSKTPPVQGEPYVLNGQAPETVKLYADLGMTAVYITPFDVVKAWFRTSMLKTTRIDFLEDSSYFEGDSYYYVCLFAGSKGEALSNFRTEDGAVDFSVVIRAIGVYGTIAFVILAFLFGLVSLIINIFRIFTYTTRKMHGFSVFAFIFALLALLCPAFATVEGTDITTAIVNYFSSIGSLKNFIKAEDTVVGVNLLFFLPAIIGFVMMFLPKLFHNRLKRRPSFVPKGNGYRNALHDPYYANEETLRRLT